MKSDILRINNLSVEYYRQGRILQAVRDVSVNLREGETLALVGESGSGKSTLAHAVLGLISPHDGRITAGAIEFGGKDLLKNTPAAWQSVRGKEIAMVFQDPFASLNPVLTTGEQIGEAVRVHYPSFSKATCREKVIAALREVMFPDPERIFGAYPHQLSGGQRQRVVLAMAIVNRPRILIADEPTTALDVTIQKEILDLLDRLKKELELTVLLITHNLPLASERSERIAVMYAGEIVEINCTADIFRKPRHPYARALLLSIPRLTADPGTRYILQGQIPDLTCLPPGCPFAPRCADVMDKCRAHAAPEITDGHSRVKCFVHSYTV